MFKIGEHIESEGAAENVDDTDEWGWIPFDGNGSIDLIVPEAWSRKVKSAIGFLHDDTVGNKLEVFIFWGDIFQDLELKVKITSSQIWLVHVCASLTL